MYVCAWVCVHHTYICVCGYIVMFVGVYICAYCMSVGVYSFLVGCMCLYIWDCFHEKGPSAYIIKLPVHAIEM